MAFFSNLFGGGAKKEKQPETSKTTDPAIQQAAYEAQRRASLARGRASTILTGGGLGNVG